MDEQSDNQLWARAVTGEPAAFGLLFERHARTIYNYLFRRCGDWSLAEDLTSVVFLEAYRRRETARLREGKVLPWLYGVATNVVRNQRRSLRRHAQALKRLPPPDRPPSLAADAIERLDAEARMRSVLAVVDQLPTSDQEVLALCVWAGLSYDDAATALGVPVGTIRSRLARARARVAELTAPSGHEPDAPPTPREGICES